jgi:SM-20-related protein
MIKTTMMKTSMIKKQLFDRIAEALLDPGYLVLDSLSETIFSQDELQGLADECRWLLSPDSIDLSKRAGVGRTNEFQVNDSIRGDYIHWLDHTTPAAKQYLEWMEELRLALNQRLFMGLFDVECHYAVYPPGTFYKKHRDAFRGQSHYQQPNRKLSTVFYLNSEWLGEDGGELVLYNETDDSPILKIAPEFGRMILFLSENFPHEVLPARRTRQSIAGWFRINNSQFM